MVVTADVRSHRGDPPDFSGRPAPRGVLLDVPQKRARVTLMAESRPRRRAIRLADLLGCRRGRVGHCASFAFPLRPQFVRMTTVNSTAAANWLTWTWVHRPSSPPSSMRAPTAFHRALRRNRKASPKRGGKLVPRAHLQFAEDACQVTLDRAGGNEEGLGDLAVREALARELGDPALAGGQRVEPCEDNAAGARTGCAKLRLRILGEGSGARAVGGVECFAEELSRFGASVASPKHGAEVGERARSFQPGVAALERLDGLTE